MIWRKFLVWDVTVNTVADLYVSSASISAGTVAENAAVRKSNKYAEMADEYLFLPIAIECLGSINEIAQDFIKVLGRMAKELSDDPRETAFLSQRLSVTLQRGNAICFKDTFDVSLVL